jgi:hypothetical protein
MDFRRVVASAALLAAAGCDVLPDPEFAAVGPGTVTPVTMKGHT